MDFNSYDSREVPEPRILEVIIDFLHAELGKYGDARQDIARCADFALGRGEEALGGFILTAREEGRLVGAVIMNKTGMKGYIPGNILVYIATRRGLRGRGIGRALMEKALEACGEGSVALHVEPDNPARRLYERMGFSSKYLEMRR